MDDVGVRELQSALKAVQRRQRRERASVEGLRQTSVRVLGVIARGGRGRQPGQIAEELQMTTSNVAAALRELEAAGLVTRARDDADTRRVNVSLTGTGQQLVVSTRVERDAWMRSAIDAALTAEEQDVLAAAARLLQRVADAGDAVGSDRPAR